jgi:hypothetical protein
VTEVTRTSAGHSGGRWPARIGACQRGQIVTSEAEIASFAASQRAARLAAVGPDEHPHMTAMCYGVVGCEL